MTQLSGHTLAFIGEGNGLNDRCAASAPDVVEGLTGRRRQRDASAMRTVCLRLAPKLTREEGRKLEARAAADLRPVANYVSYLIVQDLRDCKPSAEFGQIGGRFN